MPHRATCDKKTKPSPARLLATPNPQQKELPMHPTSPAELLFFSIQILMVAMLVTTLRRAYFTRPEFEELTAWLEARVDSGWSIRDPMSVLAKILSCKTCFTYWLTAVCAVVVVLLLPYLPPLLAWALAIPAVAWGVNNLFDHTLTTTLAQDQAPRPPRATKRKPAAEEPDDEDDDDKPMRVAARRQ